MQWCGRGLRLYGSATTMYICPTCLMPNSHCPTQRDKMVLWRRLGRCELGIRYEISNGNEQRGFSNAGNMRSNKSSRRHVSAAVVRSQNRERKCADTIVAQCRFPGLAVSNASILIYLSPRKLSRGIMESPAYVCLSVCLFVCYHDN